MLDDVAFREDSHPHFVPNKPFRYIAVRITAVIGKSTDVSFLRGIDILVKQIRNVRNNTR